MLQVIYEASSLVTATCLGISCYRYMNPFFRLLFLQLIVWDVFYIGSYIITMIQPGNGWWFNLHMPIEAALLTVAAYVYFKDKPTKALMLIIYAFFIAVYAGIAYKHGMTEFSNYGAVAEGVIVTGMFGMILYKVFTEGDSSGQKLPTIWACLGLVIYSAGIIPYISLIHYLEVYYPPISQSLFNYIIDVLANVRYFFLAFAFWILRRYAILNNFQVHA